MTYIINLDAYELHIGDGIVFNNFMMNARILHMIKADYYSKIYSYTYVNDSI